MQLLLSDHVERQDLVPRVRFSPLNVQEAHHIGSYKYLNKGSLGAETRSSFFMEAVLS